MKVGGCELCEAARMTHWHHEDSICWVADCEACDVPIVVWNDHGAEPPADQVEHMVAELERVGARCFGPDGYSIDRVMRQIPDHFHAHARDRNRWKRLLDGAPGASLSPWPGRTTGPGGEKDTGPSPG
ncbi:MAG TPA: hypothetical protein VGH66_01235 [Acidimicrobiales bacterium]